MPVCEPAFHRARDFNRRGKKEKSRRCCDAGYFSDLDNVVQDVSLVCSGIFSTVLSVATRKLLQFGNLDHPDVPELLPESSFLAEMTHAARRQLEILCSLFDRNELNCLHGIHLRTLPIPINFFNKTALETCHSQRRRAVFSRVPSSGGYLVR